MYWSMLSLVYALISMVQFRSRQKLDGDPLTLAKHELHYGQSGLNNFEYLRLNLSQFMEVILLAFTVALFVDKVMLLFEMEEEGGGGY